MDIGIPMTILTPNKEIVFNDLSGDAVGLAGTATPTWPAGLPAGNGYTISYIAGGDAAQVRNPVDNRPHAHGGIVHRFRRGAKVMTIQGLVVATSPTYRTLLDDALHDHLTQILQTDSFEDDNADARLFWTPAGKATRFQAVHLYEALSILGTAGSPGGGGVNAAPKQFSFGLVSGRPEALTYEQTVTEIGIAETLIPNNGNTETWPVIKMYPSGSTFSLVRDDGYALYWDGTPAGTYVEIDMLRETMYWDGDAGNALNGLNMTDSDFFPIPRGGATITCSGGSATVLSNDAWVGG